MKKVKTSMNLPPEVVELLDKIASSNNPKLNRSQACEKVLKIFKDFLENQDQEKFLERSRLLIEETLD